MSTITPIILPFRHSKEVPHFDSADPLSLWDYFQDYEVLAEAAGLDENTKIQKSINYLDRKDADFWESLDEYHGTDWSVFKMTVLSFYPGSDPKEKWRYEDLTNLCEAQHAKCIRTRGDFAEFDREFTRISKSLLQRELLANLESRRWYWNALDLPFRSLVTRRIEIIDHDYTPCMILAIPQIRKAARHVLIGTSVETTPSNPTQTVPVVIPAISGSFDMDNFLQRITEIMSKTVNTALTVALNHTILASTPLQPPPAPALSCETYHPSPTATSQSKDITLERPKMIPQVDSVPSMTTNAERLESSVDMRKRAEVLKSYIATLKKISTRGSDDELAEIICTLKMHIEKNGAGGSSNQGPQERHGDPVNWLTAMPGSCPAHKQGRTSELQFLAPIDASTEVNKQQTYKEDRRIHCAPVAKKFAEERMTNTVAAYVMLVKEETETQIEVPIVNVELRKDMKLNFPASRTPDEPWNKDYIKGEGMLLKEKRNGEKKRREGQNYKDEPYRHSAYLRWPQFPCMTLGLSSHLSRVILPAIPDLLNVFRRQVVWQSAQEQGITPLDWAARKLTVVWHSGFPHPSMMLSTFLSYLQHFPLFPFPSTLISCLLDVADQNTVVPSVRVPDTDPSDRTTRSCVELTDSTQIGNVSRLYNGSRATSKCLAWTRHGSKRSEEDLPGCTDAVAITLCTDILFVRSLFASCAQPQVVTTKMTSGRITGQSWENLPHHHLVYKYLALLSSLVARLVLCLPRVAPPSLWSTSKRLCQPVISQIAYWVSWKKTQQYRTAEDSPRTPDSCLDVSSAHSSPSSHHAEALRKSQSNAWFELQVDDVSGGVCLRVQPGSFRVFPYKNIFLEPFQSAVFALYLEVVVKFRSAAIHAVFGLLNDIQHYLFIDDDTHIHVLDAMEDPVTVEKDQRATFIRDESVLVVWENKVTDIILSCAEFENRLVQLVWRERIYLPLANGNGSLNGSLRFASATGRSSPASDSQTRLPQSNSPPRLPFPPPSQLISTLFEFVPRRKLLATAFSVIAVAQATWIIHNVNDIPDMSPTFNAAENDAKSLDLSSASSSSTAPSSGSSFAPSLSSTLSTPTQRHAVPSSTQPRASSTNTGSQSLLAPPNKYVLLRAYVGGPFGSSIRVMWTTCSPLLIIACGSGCSYAASVLEHISCGVTGKRDLMHFGRENAGQIKRIRNVGVVCEFAYMQRIASQIRRCMERILEGMPQVNFYVTNAISKRAGKRLVILYTLSLPQRLSLIKSLDQFSVLHPSSVQDVVNEREWVDAGLFLQGERIRVVPLLSASPPLNPPAKRFEVVRKLGSGSYAIIYPVREILSAAHSHSRVEDLALTGDLEFESDLSASSKVIYGGEYVIRCLSKANLEPDALEAQLFEANIHQFISIPPREDDFYFWGQAYDHSLDKQFNVFFRTLSFYYTDCVNCQRPSKPIIWTRRNCQFDPAIYSSTFSCPDCSLTSTTTHQSSTPLLANFTVYALQQTRLQPSMTFSALFLFSRLKFRLPAARGSSGYRLFISVGMITSKVGCDGTYSNKSWAVVTQGMFSLREIDQMEREMCGYLEWQLDPKEFRDFETEVRKSYGPHGVCPQFVHPLVMPLIVPQQPAQIEPAEDGASFDIQPPSQQQPAVVLAAQQSQLGEQGPMTPPALPRRQAVLVIPSQGKSRRHHIHHHPHQHHDTHLQTVLSPKLITVLLAAAALAANPRLPSQAPIPSRRSMKMLKDGSDFVWPDSVHALFVQGLQAGKMLTISSKRTSAPRSEGRTDFLVRFFLSHGIDKTKREVTFHLQVFQTEWRDLDSSVLPSLVDEAHARCPCLNHLYLFVLLNRYQVAHPYPKSLLTQMMTLPHPFPFHSTLICLCVRWHIRTPQSDNEDPDDAIIVSMSGMVVPTPVPTSGAVNFIYKTVPQFAATLHSQ